MITIGIIEDDDIIRNIIYKFLNKQNDISCNIASDSVEAFYDSVNEENCPQIVLSDIGLPGMNGIEGIRKIKTDFPKTDFIMLTVHEDSNKIFDALKAGASGYLIKSESLDEIKYAIEDIHDGLCSAFSYAGAADIEEFHKKVKWTT